MTPADIRKEASGVCLADGRPWDEGRELLLVLADMYEAVDIFMDSDTASDTDLIATLQRIRELSL